LLAVWLGTLRKAMYGMVNVTVLAEIARSACSRALTATPPGPVKVAVSKVPASQQSSRQKRYARNGQRTRFDGQNSTAV